jgi:RTX calcium-binding nonapeptide repeat (4 copies)
VGDDGSVRVLGLALAVSVAVTTIALAPGARGEEMLRFETRDWIFSAPASLGTQADLELQGRAVQLCHDEIRVLIGYRPPEPAKFTVLWIVDGQSISYAYSTGYENHVSPSYRLVTPESRAFREKVVADGVCFGPHEVTHVLTNRSWGPAWANEGFATFTDRLYWNASWRCCAAPVELPETCDADGYTLWGARYAYADLSPFVADSESYSTAACLWIEVHARGGFPAIRGILRGMRYEPPSSAGELAVHQVNRVLNVDVRPILRRYGFEPAELEASPAPAIPGCTLIGTAAAEAFSGTSGHDVLCGLAGSDALRGGAGADSVLGGAGSDRLSGDSGRDVLDGGPGPDFLDARDGRRDVVRGGPGRDTARIDRRLDRVFGVERLLR